MSTRNILLVAVVVLSAGAAAIGYWLSPSPELAQTRLLVDGGLLVALVLAVLALMRKPRNSVDGIEQALRELAAGNTGCRLEPAQFGELKEIARSFNVVCASLTEREDPNLGPVRTKKRDGPMPYQTPRAEDNDVGEVRVMSEARKKELANKTIVEPAGPLRSAPEPSIEPKVAEKKPEVAAAEENPTIIDDDETAGVRDLFAEFVDAHNGKSAALSYDEFAQTISEQRAELIKAHGCLDVRFEVKVQDGEVSLLPHLLRE